MQRVSPFRPGASRCPRPDLVSGIDRLGTFARRPRLALSLNGTTDEARSRIMPVNRVWNLEALAQALGRFPLQSGERITHRVRAAEGGHG